MKEVVLVDSQAARVRLFREALAVYRERFQQVKTRSEEARAEAASQVEIARRAARAMRHSLGEPTPYRQPGGPEEQIRLHVFPCLAEALKFLRKEAPYEWAPRATVVFTDLYLEGHAGISMIRQLKADPALREIPAVMLCSGATREEVRKAWEAGSNAVVDLPAQPPDMLDRVADTLEFWLDEATR